jgi:hypothetical protein
MRGPTLLADRPLVLIAEARSQASIVKSLLAYPAVLIIALGSFGVEG